MTEAMREEIIPLAGHIKPDVQRICILIAHHEGILNSLQRELGQLLRVGQNVDVSEPGWHLDPVGGVIIHRVPVPNVSDVSDVSSVVPELEDHEPESAPGTEPGSEPA